MPPIRAFAVVVPTLAAAPGTGFAGAVVRPARDDKDLD